MKKLYICFLLYINFQLFPCVTKSQTISLGTGIPASACTGTSFNISYVVSGGTFLPATTVIAQISDAAGMFTTPLATTSSTGGGSGSLSVFIPVSATPGTAYKIRVTESTTPLTISDTFALTIKANVGPVVFTDFDGTPCEGKPFTYRAIAPNATQYTFIVNGGTPVSQGPGTADSIVVRFSGSSVPGAKSIQVTAANTCPTASLSLITVNVRDTIKKPMFFPPPPNHCQGQSSATYSAVSTGGTGVRLSYAIVFPIAPISPGILSAPGIGGVKLTYYTGFSGPVQIEVTATDSCGNSKKDTATIIVHPAPVLAAGTPRVVPVCSHKPLNIPLAGGQSYSWVASADPAITIYGPNSTSGTVLNDSLVNASNGDQKNLNLFVTTTSAFGCQSLAFDTIKITVYPRPSLAVVSPTAICSGAKPAFKLISTTGSGSSFNWTFMSSPLIAALGPNGGNTDSISSPNLMDSSSASKAIAVYSVIVTSPGSLQGCSNTQTIYQEVNPKPVMLNSNPPAICSGGLNNIRLSPSDTFANVSWTINNNLVSGDTAGSGSTIAQRLINPTVTDQYVVYSVTPTSVAGCIGTARPLVDTVHSTPEILAPLANASFTYCSDTALNVALSSTLASNFSWTATPLKPFLSISHAGSPTGPAIMDRVINQTANTVITQTYILSNLVPATGCADTPISFSVTVNPKPQFNRVSGVICSGDSTNIDLAGNITSNSTSGNKFKWSAVNANLVTGQADNTPFSSVSRLRQRITDSSNSLQGSIDYIITPQSADGCIGDTVRAHILVNPLPVMQSAAAKTICSDQALNYLVISSTGTASRYAYTSVATPNNIATRNQDTTGIANLINDTLSSSGALTPSTVTYHITLKSAAGCVNPDQVLTVTVQPTPAAPGITELLIPFPKRCEGIRNLNLSTIRQPDPLEYIVWSAPGTARVSQNFNLTYSGHALADFPVADPAATIIATAYARGYSCGSRESSKSYAVGQANMPPVSVLKYYDNLICKADHVISYQWGFDNKADLTPHWIPNATTQNLDVQNPQGFTYDPSVNAYWVLVTFTDSCMQKAYCNPPSLGAPQPPAPETSMRIFPNPVTDYLHVQTAPGISGELTYTIRDFTGRQLRQVHTTAPTTDIPTHDLVPGCYFLICSQSGIQIAAASFIRQ